MNNIEILENCWLMKTNHVLDEENKKVRQSIENLIKENKELKDKCKELNFKYTAQWVDDNFISKDKIKEKIKEYNIPILDVLDKLPIPRNIEVGIGAKDGIIYVLQELLEEGE